MTPIVRAFRPSDAEAAAEVRSAALPFLVTTPAMPARRAEREPAERRYRALVAELDGQVVGLVEAGLLIETAEPDAAFAHLYVHPGATGRGAGSALATAAEGHLSEAGAGSVYTWVYDDGRSPAWAERRGYRRRRMARFLRLDLAGTPLPAETAPPAGITLRTAAGFAADPRPLYELDMETTADEPGDVTPDAMPYAAWLTANWERPSLDRDLSVVAVDAAGVPVAFTVADTDGRTRYMTTMTGTARSHRGRGLAKLVKNRSLRLAREAGYREAFTGNDAENGPMPAVNRWFGYEPAGGEWRYVRELRL
ncbi:GNAT family N-acetyltransferase [Streptomyces sp. NPDC049577]|uniref:GNAT family N-acetyltransferase n=1 Tax=Streptomyces sp. NPDC049577 TaxID=3155153 RepID=UPI00344A9FB9